MFKFQPSVVLPMYKREIIYIYNFGLKLQDHVFTELCDVFEVVNLVLDWILASDEYGRVGLGFGNIIMKPSRKFKSTWGPSWMKTL